MHLLLRTLLTLAHFLYDFILTTRSYWRDFWRQPASDGCADLPVVLDSLSKRPQHFVLILGLEEPSVADLIKIITWCLVSGIPYVTFYDSNGRLKKEEEFLKQEFLRCKPELEENIEWNPEPSMKTIKNGINGIKHKTRIQCLSYEDGKGKIAALTQDFAKAVKMGSINVDDITIELMESKLNPEKVPEPDLAIVCGEALSTYGFLPWHTRVTDFHLLSTHHRVTMREFVNVLKSYSQCEQRYGK